MADSKFNYVRQMTVSIPTFGDDVPELLRSFDLELFHCPICCEPFTVPIFQCENGHTVCSLCCGRLEKKCPSCALPNDYIRCRAIEKVIESFSLCCRNWNHGCKKAFPYGQAYLEHEKTCKSAPCSCPIPGCTVTNGSSHLYFHLNFFHRDQVTTFLCDIAFTISFTIDETFLVLGEKNEQAVFLLTNRVEQSWNVISIIYIAPSSKKGYWYDLVAKIGGTNHSFRSFTKNIQDKYGVTSDPSFGLFLDPVSAVGHNGMISLDICIWNHGSTPGAI